MAEVQKIAKKRAPYYWDRGGYYFRKWVPKRYRTVDPRQTVVICLHTKDELEGLFSSIAAGFSQWLLDGAGLSQIRRCDV